MHPLVQSDAPPVLLELLTPIVTRRLLAFSVYKVGTLQRAHELAYLVLLVKQI